MPNILKEAAVAVRYFAFKNIVIGILYYVTVTIEHIWTYLIIGSKHKIPKIRYQNSPASPLLPITIFHKDGRPLVWTASDPSFLLADLGEHPPDLDQDP
jgi:hypothetical protein